MTTPASRQRDLRQFGAVAIECQCSAARDRCRVRVHWLSALILDEVLDANRRVQAFSVSSERDPALMVEGELRFDPGNDCLFLVYLRTPQGNWRDELLCNGHPPPPPPPPPPDPRSPVLSSTVSSGASPLFPYLYLRDWPQTSAEDRQDRFVDYLATTCGLDDPRLYCALVAIGSTAPDARARCESAASDFVADREPYTGQYAGSAAALLGPIRHYAAFARGQAERDSPDLPEFLESLRRGSGLGWIQTCEYVTTAEFQWELERAWQTTFALCVLAGYNRPGLMQMLRTVLIARLIVRMVVTTPPLSDEDVVPLPPADYWTPERLYAGIHATVLLPTPPFPLPPLGTTSSVRNATGHADGSVQPYAIGELRQVERQLLRYEPGELKHVENVMAGELKSSRVRERSGERRIDHTAEREERDDRQQQEGRADVFGQAVMRALSEQFKQHFTSAYGPPTDATQSSEWSQDPPSNGPNRLVQRSDTRLARAITQRAVRHVSAEIELRRRQETWHENETDVRHRFDRARSEQNIRGIYRWLNAVYRCSVRRCGRRFVLQLVLPEPATAYAEAQYQLAGIDRIEPTPPWQLGLSTFEDISVEPTSTLYFAKLASRYGVDDVEPPPALVGTRSATFQSGDALGSQVLTLPDGYAADAATVSLVGGDGTLTLAGVLGDQAFKLTGSDGGSHQALTLAGQIDSLPLALSAWKTPVTDSHAAEPDWAVALELDLVLAPEALARWKSRLYGRLLAGWRVQRERYFATAGVRPDDDAAADPLRQRDTIRAELIRGARLALAQRVEQLTGERERELRFLPALLAYVDRVFEWSELSFSFLQKLTAPGGSSWRRRGAATSTLVDFLDAAYARLLLPVTPGHEAGVAWFLATGVPWDGDDRLAPTFMQPIDPAAGVDAQRWLDLVNDLKDSAAAPDRDEGMVDGSWDIVLPTTMTWLQDGSDLPEFPEPWSERR